MSRNKFLFSCIFVLALAFTTHIAFIYLTAHEFDENVYRFIAEMTRVYFYPTLLIGGNPGDYYAYNPPFYFFLVSFWMRITGSTSIESIRILSSLIATATTGAVMWCTYIMTKSQRATLIAGFLTAIDGWFIYTSLLVKMDTGSILVGTLGMAMLTTLMQDKTTRKTAVITGLLIGFAAIFKHVGVVFIAAAFFNWIYTMVRLRRGGFQIYVILVIGIVVIAYFFGMACTVEGPYLKATAVQLRRMLGLQASNGLNYGMSEAFVAIGKTYWAFAGTIIVSILAILVSTYEIGWNLILHWRKLEFPLLMLWMVSAVAVLIAIKLRNPHYLGYALVPANMIVAIKIDQWLLPRDGRVLNFLVIVIHLSDQHVYLIARNMFLLISFLHVVTMLIRIFSFSGADVYKAVGRYATANFPPGTIVIADESFCAALPEPGNCYPINSYKTMAQIRGLEKRLGKPVQVLIEYYTFAGTQKVPDTDGVRLIESCGDGLPFTDWKGRATIIIINIECMAKKIVNVVVKEGVVHPDNPDHKKAPLAQWGFFLYSNYFV